MVLLRGGRGRAVIVSESGYAAMWLGVPFPTARTVQTRYAASTSPVLSFEEMSPQAPETLCTGA